MTPHSSPFRFWLVSLEDFDAAEGAESCDADPVLGHLAVFPPDPGPDTPFPTGGTAAEKRVWRQKNMLRIRLRGGGFPKGNKASVLGGNARVNILRLSDILASVLPEGEHGPYAKLAEKFAKNLIQDLRKVSEVDVGVGLASMAATAAYQFAASKCLFELATRSITVTDPLLRMRTEEQQADMLKRASELGNSSRAAIASAMSLAQKMRPKKPAAGAGLDFNKRFGGKQ